MISKLAEEKLSKYKELLSERNRKLEEAEEKQYADIEKDNVYRIYNPPINMLACEFANQVIADMEEQK